MADTAAALGKAGTPCKIESAQGSATIPASQQPTEITTRRRGKRQPLTPEERKERVDALTGRLQAGVPELADANRWAAFLQAAQGFGTIWSFNNSC